jgi:hypothetical protein
MKKIMLIAGCSHASGSEIDGTPDSKYNRENSFGNVLANKMGYEAVNIAVSGSTNPSIARSILEWFYQNYNPDTMEVFVVVGWTESTRIEIPSDRPHWYNDMNKSSDWFPTSAINYLRINQGYPGANDWERELVKYYHEFIVKNLKYLEITSANLVLQIEYFLKMHKLDYVMCNTMHMFDNNGHLRFYLDKIDKTRYYNLEDTSQDFYWKYRNAGYENPKAQYWHHNEIPHQLYADELQNFILSNRSGISQ